MKTSIYTWFGYYLPFKERLKHIKEAGFDEVMISWEDELPPFECSRFEFPHLVKEAGLGITNAHSSFIGYNRIWEDSESEDLLELYKSWVKECHEGGIDTLIVHTNDTNLSNYKIENGLNFFQKLGEYAKDYDFNIAIENVTRQFLLDKIFDTIKLDNIGLCYDCGHDYITHCGRGRLIKKYGDRIKAVHLQDNDFYIDRHWLPGEGRIDFKTILPEIYKSGYDTISLEVKADPSFWAGREISEFLKKAHQSARRLESLII